MSNKDVDRSFRKARQQGFIVEDRGKCVKIIDPKTGAHDFFHRTTDGAVSTRQQLRRMKKLGVDLTNGRKK